MKQKIISIILLVTLVVTGFSGCVGVVNNNEDKTLETVKEEKDVETYKVTDLSMPISSIYSDCTTLDDVIEKIPEGTFYAKINLDGDEAVLIADETYKYDDNTTAAISAQVFSLKEGKRYYSGVVLSSGTAYPISTDGSILYLAGGHYVSKVKIENGTLSVIEENFVNYDTNGTGHFYASKNGNIEDSTGINLEKAFEEFENSKIINFIEK